MFKFFITNVVLVIISYLFIGLTGLEIKYSKKQERPTISFFLSEENVRVPFYLNTYMGLIDNPKE